MNKKIIFIIGNGRSGTHLLGRSIASHLDIHGRVETPNTFKLITKIATTQDFTNPLYVDLLKIILVYRIRKSIKNSLKHVLEKSHTSLWLVDHLITKFDNSYFIGIYRDLEQTVSSMLEHNGILSWYKKLPQNQENRFLGITKDNKSYFNLLSLEEKCALRWLSHKKELFRLYEKYPNRVRIIKYNDFVLNPESNLSAISSFLDIPNEFDYEKIKYESLSKWKEKLDNNQIKKIINIIKINE